MAAVAVRITGLRRVRPASTRAWRRGMPWARRMSVNSMSRMPFFTTMPARARMPTPVITMEIVMPVRA